MLNTADLVVCIFLFVIQGQLDGFPISRLPSNRDDLLWSTSAQPSESTDMFPDTRPCKHDDWSSSITSPLLLHDVTCRHKRIQTSNDLTPSPAARRMSSLSGKNDSRKAILQHSTQPSPTENEIGFSPLSDENSSRKVSNTFRRSSTNNIDALSSSPSSKNESEKFPMTTSFAMRMQSNFRLSKEKESPMILFDQNGKMYTNFYPPIGYQSNGNKQRANDVDWGRQYLPKWLVIGGNKT